MVDVAVAKLFALLLVRRARVKPSRTDQAPLSGRFCAAGRDAHGADVGPRRRPQAAGRFSALMAWVR
jgi:hypothetical protein